MNPVVHFEMPAEDRTRMRAFYEKTFGWQTEQLGPVSMLRPDPKHMHKAKKNGKARTK